MAHPHSTPSPGDGTTHDPHVIRRHGEKRVTLACHVEHHAQLAEAMADELITLANQNRPILDAVDIGFSILHTERSRAGLAEFLDRLLMRPLGLFFGTGAPDLWHFMSRAEPVVPELLRKHLGQDSGIMMGLTIDYGLFGKITSGGSPDVHPWRVNRLYIDEIIGGVVFSDPSGTIIESYGKAEGGERHAQV